MTTLTGEMDTSLLFFLLHASKLALQSVGSHEKVLCRWSLGKSVAFLSRWMVCWVCGGNELQGEGKTTDKASEAAEGF